MSSLSPFCVSGRVECGVDEVGCGALCGPVVAAAVIWPSTLEDTDICDSKKLSPSKRQRLAEYIKQNAVAYAIEFVDNHTIDEINILNATYKAMHGAIASVASQNHHIDALLIDGNRFKPYDGISHECVVKGDNTYLSIAAASILAKVARDQYMADLASKPQYSMYGLAKNAGYGTAEHIRALRNHGPSDMHRLTFAKVS